MRLRLHLHHQNMIYEDKQWILNVSFQKYIQNAYQTLYAIAPSSYMINEGLSYTSSIGKSLQTLYAHEMTGKEKELNANNTLSNSNNMAPMNWHTHPSQPFKCQIIIYCIVSGSWTMIDSYELW